MSIFTQQGDCILVELPVLPNCKRIPVVGDSFVLLKGEGVNTHELQSATLANDVEMYEGSDGTLYLKTLVKVPLVHQEHGTTVLPAHKTFRRQIEREWDYEAEEARNTKD